MTYVPAGKLWVRVADIYDKDTYVLRADAQEMAHSLLQMPWHPESYLLGASRGSMGMCLLTGVSHRVVPVAHRISSGID